MSHHPVRVALATLTALGFVVANSALSRAAESVPPPAPLPTPATMPTGPEGDSIRLGQRMFMETGETVPDHVGNALTCANCHLGGGTQPFASPMIGVYGLFPMFRSRGAKVERIEGRINDCFERSMNGKALGMESAEMTGMVSYIAWLSRGVPVGTEIPGRGFKKLKPTRKPDPILGQALFQARCIACHGPDGQGTAAAPPLWGDRSYNIGAGMARINTLAAFIQANMPFGQGNTLSVDEAYDVGTFVNSHKRPDFARKMGDWAKGSKPPDSPY